MDLNLSQNILECPSKLLQNSDSLEYGYFSQILLLKSIVCHLISYLFLICSFIHSHLFITIITTITY